MSKDKEGHIANLKSKFESYSSITEKSWLLIESIISFQTLTIGEILLRNGQIAKNIHFICEGALRAFVTDYEGNT